MLKGVCRVDDALRAVDAGVTAISVSNHGGNNLDGTPAAIRMVQPDRRRRSATRSRCVMDGGIRRGSDVVKAARARRPRRDDRPRLPVGPRRQRPGRRRERPRRPARRHRLRPARPGSRPRSTSSRPSDLLVPDGFHRELGVPGHGSARGDRCWPTSTWPRARRAAARPGARRVDRAARPAPAAGHRHRHRRPPSRRALADTAAAAASRRRSATAPAASTRRFPGTSSIGTDALAARAGRAGPLAAHLGRTGRARQRARRQPRGASPPRSTSSADEGHDVAWVPCAAAGSTPTPAAPRPRSCCTSPLAGPARPRRAGQHPPARRAAAR